MKTLIFAKRNFKEIIREPLLYIFCAGFPLFMITMFQIIVKYASDHLAIFELNSLIPGIMMFSYSLIMLMVSLHISKDKTQSFLKRLYTSPMKGIEYIFGYFIPCFIIGLIQSFICIILGYIFALINNTTFTSFPSALLLIVSMIPIMMTNIFIGMIFGILLSDKSAPAFSSIFISLSGVIGGAWMPLDTMGNFEIFARFFPFHPSVYIGRIITKCNHTLLDTNGNLVPFDFKDNGILFLVIIFIYLITTFILALVLFKKKLNDDN